MGTVHEDLAEAVLERFMDDPSTIATLIDLRSRVISREFEEHHLGEAIGCSGRFQPKRWPLEQHAAFLQVFGEIMIGSVAKVMISTGGSPGPDADRSGNSKLLEQTHFPFEAELDMHQHGADMDGVLRWPEPITLERSTGVAYPESACPNARMTPFIGLTGLPSGWAPLEVGDSWPSRTLMHLRQYGAVARWPYSSKRIWLFVDLSDAPLGRTWGH
ncbi:hypothetical protein [Streptomyces sp. NPDC056244]|uniref:hypothetical protein n=1 Tax=Streptomyces sp. NPDC056244 TaxID=3345762 RepID=UPI0035E125DD